MKPLLFTLSAAADLAQRLGNSLGVTVGTLERRQFPDGESYLRLVTPVEGRDVILLSSLDHPDPKSLALLFTAEAARNQGARSVGLVAPYLAYMRQDKAFRPGEAVTSQTFARLMSSHFDWLVTLDPHLHRYPSLDALYSIPAFAVSAAGPIAAWIRGNVEKPLLIGPDEESAQWVERIATLAGVPFAVFHKERRGDFDVRLSGTHIDLAPGVTPVLVDDIASSARTMVEAVRSLKAESKAALYCIVVHAIFSGDAFDRLAAFDPAMIVSTNSVAHPTNAIDISEPLVAAVRTALAAGST